MQTEISIDEKIFSYKKIWQNEMDKKQEYNVDLSKVTKRQHGRFYYKYIFYLKIFMIFVSISTLVFLFRNLSVLYHTEHLFIPCVASIIYTFVEVYWYCLFALRIYQMNINDHITTFKQKQNFLLFMEKLEIIVTLIVFIPTYVFVIVPFNIYFSSGWDCYDSLYPIIRRRVFFILFCIIAGSIWYYLNITAIKKIKEDISLKDIKINLNIFKYELYTR